MTTVQAAWLAAAIDGEGSLSFTVEKKSRERKYQLFARIRLQVCNDNRAFLRNAQRIVGGGYIGKRPRPATKNVPARIGYALVVRTPALIEPVLRTCLPFFIVKRPKVMVALRFLAFYRKLLSKPLLDPDRTVRARRSTTRRTLRSRLRRGLPLGQCLETPVDRVRYPRRRNGERR